MDIDKTIADYLAHAKQRHFAETNQTALGVEQIIKVTLELAALIGPLAKPAWPPKPPAKPPASVPSVRPAEDRTCAWCHKDDDQTVIWRPRFDAPPVYLHDRCIIAYADDWHRAKQAAKQAEKQGSDDAA
jgi:hypothetical protein